MSNPRELDEILGDWARSGVPLEQPETSPVSRERVVARIAAAVRRQARARVARRRMVFVALAVAAVALAIVGFSGLHARFEPPAPIASVTVEDARGATRPLAVGEVVDVLLEQVRLRLPSGAVVEIRPRSRVVLADAAPASESIELSAGEVEVVVPKLGSSAQFSVRTPDARVVVHGTRFRVSVTEAGAPRTSVSVIEGTVSVHHAGRERFVSAGSAWPAPRQAAPRSPPIPKPAAAEPRQQSRATSPGAAGSAPSSKPATSVALAEQNRLFASARAARSRGDDRGAIHWLDELIGRYPHGPLTPEARVERFRALKRLGEHQAAANEAKQYLLEQRDGYARDEARELVLPPKR